MKIAATGHRPDKLGGEYNLNGPISKFLKRRFIEIFEEFSPTECISGMALGVDTLYALTALEMGINVHAAIPFIGQERIWPKSSQDLYYQILDNPLVEKVIVCEGGYSPKKMQIRNEYMCNRCDMLTAVWDGSKGGTHNCVKFADRIGKRILRIDPTEIT